MNAAIAIPITSDLTDPLGDAVNVFVAAKRDEEIANRRRIAAEERILALHPAREEGSDTFEAGGFKVTLTGKLTYKCENTSALAETCVGLQWNPAMMPVKTRLELDATGCKWLRQNNPDAWRQIAGHITVAPAKTAVTVKV